MKGDGKNGSDGKYGSDGQDLSRNTYEIPTNPVSSDTSAPHNSHFSHDSHTSHKPRDPHPIIPQRGDYQTLHSFQKSEVIYDLTFRFVHKFLSKGDRTVDQMIQAARSGKKNILEGSKAASTSKETEIKLTNVGRASLEELLDDYRDFLRARDQSIWGKDSKEALYVRRLGRRTPQTYEIYRELIESRPAEVVANIAICLIHQANYLIDQQLRRLEKDFLKDGGLRERMTRARLAHRNKPQHPDRSYEIHGSYDSLDPHNSHTSHDSHTSHEPRGKNSALPEASPEKPLP